MLLNHIALRIYQLVDLKGKVHGEDVGQNGPPGAGEQEVGLSLFV